MELSDILLGLLLTLLYTPTFVCVKFLYLKFGGY